LAWDALFVVATLVAAYFLKRHYSLATPDELWWVLAPTAQIVESVLGTAFIEEAHAGFMSRELEFVIAPSCAGVNFLIIAFSMFVLAFVPTRRTLRGKILLWIGGACVAYGLTLVVNSLRILIAIWLRGRGVAFGVLDAETVHRVEGVAVYFVSLCVFYLAARALLRRPDEVSHV
jgi:exosortase K